MCTYPESYRNSEQEFFMQEKWRLKSQHHMQGHYIHLDWLERFDNNFIFSDFPHLCNLVLRNDDAIIDDICEEIQVDLSAFV